MWGQCRDDGIRKGKSFSTPERCICGQGLNGKYKGEGVNRGTMNRV